MVIITTYVAHLVFPSASDDDLQKVKVEYLTLPGWKTNTEDVRKWEDLPPNAQSYINAIQDHLNVPGRLLSCFCFSSLSRSCGDPVLQKKCHSEYTHGLFYKVV